MMNVIKMLKIANVGISIAMGLLSIAKELAGDKMTSMKADNKIEKFMTDDQNVEKIAEKVAEHFAKRRGQS